MNNAVLGHGRTSLGVHPPPKKKRVLFTKHPQSYLKGRRHKYLNQVIVLLFNTNLLPLYCMWIRFLELDCSGVVMIDCSNEVCQWLSAASSTSSKSGLQKWGIVPCRFSRHIWTVHPFSELAAKKNVESQCNVLYINGCNPFLE